MTDSNLDKEFEKYNEGMKTILSGNSNGSQMWTSPEVQHIVRTSFESGFRAGERSKYVELNTKSSDIGGAPV